MHLAHDAAAFDGQRLVAARFHQLLVVALELGGLLAHPLLQHAGQPLVGVEGFDESLDQDGRHDADEQRRAEMRQVDAVGPGVGREQPQVVPAEADLRRAGDGEHAAFQQAVAQALADQHHEVDHRGEQRRQVPDVDGIGGQHVAEHRRAAQDEVGPRARLDERPAPSHVAQREHEHQHAAQHLRRLHATLPGVRRQRRKQREVVEADDGPEHRHPAEPEIHRVRAPSQPYAQHEQPDRERADAHDAHQLVLPEHARAPHGQHLVLRPELHWREPALLPAVDALLDLDLVVAHPQQRGRQQRVLRPVPVQRQRSAHGSELAQVLVVQEQAPGAIEPDQVHPEAVLRHRGQPEVQAKPCVGQSRLIRCAPHLGQRHGLPSATRIRDVVAQAGATAELGLAEGQRRRVVRRIGRGGRRPAHRRHAKGEPGGEAARKRQRQRGAGNAAHAAQPRARRRRHAQAHRRALPALAVRKLTTGPCGRPRTPPRCASAPPACGRCA